MGNRGFKAGKILGIEIFIDYSWLIIFAIVVWVFSSQFFPLKYSELSQNTYYFLGIISAILFFTSALIHKFAHSLTAKSCDIKINKITLFLFGGFSELLEELRKASSEFKIAIAGPASSVVLAFVFAVLWSISEKYSAPIVIIAITSTLFQVNLILAIFNMLPGFPLDGGRIL